MSATPATDIPDDSDPGALRLRFEHAHVSDVEVAAVTVAVAALLGSAGPSPQPEPDAPWRRAGLLEASTAQRIRSPAELHRAEAR